MSDWIEKLLEWPGQVLEFGMRILEPLLVASLSSAVAAVIFVALVYGVWTAIGASLQREERARCFLQMLDIGLRQGTSVEQTLSALAQARVRDMGVLFHLLAAWIDRGLRLSAALAEVPRFLPPQIAAMLQTGEAIGDLGRVLPACRESLQGGTSDSRKQLNNTLVMFFVLPIGPAIIWVLSIYVFPKFRELALDMGVGLGPTFDRILYWSFILGLINAGLWLVLWLFETGRVGGNWLLRGLGPGMEWVCDWVFFRLPWRRKRLQRDFSAMLAVLLDAGLTEERALELAGRSTANRVFQRHTDLALIQLRSGAGLARALELVDAGGEFGWRLRNACHSSGTGSGFVTALAGWNASLEARAFQQEQIFSQATTTGFVLLNGLMIGLATSAIFHFLTSTLNSIE